MAKEKVEVEFIPEVSSGGFKSLVDAFSGALAASTKGKSLFGDSLEKAVSSFKSGGGVTGVQQSFKGLFSGAMSGQGAATTAGADVAAFAGPVGIAIAVGAKLKEVLGQVLEFAQKTFDTIKGLVAVANPGVVERFDAAWDDISAVLGHTLTPIIERLIPVIQDLGDFIASILPDAADIDKIMVEMQPIWEDLKNVLVVLAPILRDVAIGTAKFIAQLARLLVLIGRTLPEGQLLQMTGSAGQGRGFDRSARGAAAGGAQFTSLEQLGKNFQLAAFSSGLPPMNRTADAAESIDKKMDRLVVPEPVEHPSE